MIDGKLDDIAWRRAAWTTDFVDITRHVRSADNQVPSNVQARKA